MKTPIFAAIAVATSLVALDAAAADSATDYADRTKAAAEIEKEQSKEDARAPTRFFAFVRAGYITHVGNHVGAGNVSVTENGRTFDDSAEFLGFARETVGAGIGLRFGVGGFDAQARLSLSYVTGSFQFTDPVDAKYPFSGFEVVADTTIRPRFYPGSPLFWGIGPELGYSSFSGSGLPSDEMSAILVHAILELGIYLGDHERIEIAARLSGGFDVLGSPAGMLGGNLLGAYAF